MPGTADRVVRDATPADDDGIVAVARAHDFDGPDTAVDHHYRTFVSSHGRLVVASVDGRIVGFGGAIDVDGARLVTDLFLLDENQGRGHGGAMLAALLDGHPRRMTFSSGHARAIPTYERFGMVRAWVLDYWSGRAPGAATSGAELTVHDEPLDRWRGDRPDLAEHWWRHGGRLLRLARDGEPDGWAIVVPPPDALGTWHVTRLVSRQPEAAIRVVLSVIPAGAEVLVCVPEQRGLGSVLGALGFTVTDQDTFCASEGVTIDPTVAALHPGLG
jgi:hypothetical protein